MNAERQELMSKTEGAQWAACPILLWGIFGTKSPAERRFIMRCCYAGAVAAGWVVVAFSLHLTTKRVFRPVIALLGGGVITYIAWEFRRYLLQLDELARRMQFEAMAWTYLTGLALAAWLGVLLPFSRTLTHWPYKPGFLLLTPFLFFVLEPIRAAWLYYLSRRY
jgi:hypothetical protein